MEEKIRDNNPMVQLLCWAKQHGVTFADGALEEWCGSRLQKLYFHEHVSAYGSYYTLELEPQELSK